MKAWQKRVKPFDIKAYEKELWSYRKEHNRQIDQLSKQVRLMNGLFKDYLRKAEKKKDPQVLGNIALFYGLFRDVYENIRRINGLVGHMNYRFLEVEANAKINDAVMETLKEATFDNCKMLYEHLPRHFEELRSHATQAVGLSRQAYVKTAREKRNFDRQLREVMPAIDWYRELQNHAPKTTRE